VDSRSDELNIRVGHFDDDNDVRPARAGCVSVGLVNGKRNSKRKAKLKEEGGKREKESIYTVETV